MWLALGVYAFITGWYVLAFACFFLWALGDN